MSALSIFAIVYPLDLSVSALRAAMPAIAEPFSTSNVISDFWRGAGEGVVMITVLAFVWVMVLVCFAGVCLYAI